MKAVALTLAILCASAASLRADLVLVQRVKGSGRNGDMTIRFKDGSLRADLAQEISVIAAKDSGEVVTLMHKQKRLLRVPQSQLKAMQEQMATAAATAAATSGPAKLEPTGRKEKIGEYETEIYSWKVGTISATYWIAPNVPHADKLVEQMEKIQESGLGMMTNGVGPSPKDFPGLPIQTEMKTGAQTVRTTILSLKEQPVDAAIFTLPKGYTEIGLPDGATPALEPEAPAPE